MPDVPTATLAKTFATTMIGANDPNRPLPWKQLGELYKIYPHLAAAAAILAASILPYAVGGRHKVIAVVAILALQLLVRATADWKFRRRSSDAAFQRWLRGFVVISLLSGISWGTSLAILYLGSGPQAQVVVLAVGCGIVQSCAARAYMAPASTALLILIIIGIVNVAALSEGNWLMLPICFAYIAFQANYMTQLVELEQARAAAEQQTVALLVELAESNERLRHANQQLTRHAATDGLTALANRRSFDADLNAATTEANASGQPLSLLLLDIDHFKRFNDTHGHLAGDECLRRVGQMLVEDCGRWHCHPARYGGEEFAIIVPGATQRDAEALATHLLGQVSTLDLTDIAGQSAPLTLSIGIATAGPEEGAHALLDRADQGLYAAKQAGRNCVRSLEKTAPIGTHA